MADYTAFDESPAILLQSRSAAASLSFADANFDGVKHHGVTRLQNGVVAMTSIVGLTALASVGTAVTAMILEGSILIYICFALPLLVAPCVMYQRSRLQWLPTFRDESNTLRMNVNDWAVENSHIQSEIDRLQRQINRLSMVEKRFEQLCSRERKEVDVMKRLVKENSAVLQEMKKLQAADDIQELMSSILKADKDCDFILTDKELDEVLARMRVVAGRNGSKFDEQAIRAAFKNSLTRKGSSLIRIHSTMQDESEDMEESKEDPPKLIVHTPVQSLQKIPRNDETETFVDTFTKQNSQVASEVSIPFVLSTGLVVTRSHETYGTVSQPINLVKASDAVAESGADPPGQVVNPSDDTVLRNLLAREGFDSVGGDKEETQSISYILQSFSGNAQQKESV